VPVSAAGVAATSCCTDSCSCNPGAPPPVYNNCCCCCCWGAASCRVMLTSIRVRSCCRCPDRQHSSSSSSQASHTKQIDIDY
jgi:hypothetical protein